MITYVYNIIPSLGILAVFPTFSDVNGFGGFSTAHVIRQGFLHHGRIRETTSPGPVTF